MAVDETATGLRLGPPSFLRYGLGWDCVSGSGAEVRGRAGLDQGRRPVDYHASFAIAPDQGLGGRRRGCWHDFQLHRRRNGRADCAAQRPGRNRRHQEDAEADQRHARQGQGDGEDGRQEDQATLGHFLAQNETKKLSEAKDRSVKVATLADGAWVRSPGRFELRNDGRFWATRPPGTSISAVKSWGRTYVLQRSIGGVGTYYSYVARGQKVRSGGALSPAWQARVGKKWLLANESPESLSWTLSGSPVVKIAPIPGLSGYLLATGALVDSVPFDATTSDTAGRCSWRFPWGSAATCWTSTSRRRVGEEYLSFDSSVLRPAATVPDLAAGSNNVTIGSAGLGRVVSRFRPRPR